MVIECQPAASTEVISVASPEESSAALPNGDAPSRNLTVPTGLPDAGASTLTVAVNVTAWPKTEGFTEELTAILV